MSLAVVGAGVGRTGTHSLSLALERLLGGPCHHMMEVTGSRTGAGVDRRHRGPSGRLVADAGEVPLVIVDWPGGSFWRELLAANPDALVLLSVRDANDWYRSASNTIFLVFDRLPQELKPWMDAVRKMLHERFSDRFDDPAGMIDAVPEPQRSGAPRGRRPAQLLEWQASDGWEPICERLGLPVPSEPFPVTNTTDEFRADAWSTAGHELSRNLGGGTR